MSSDAAVDALLPPVDPVEFISRFIPLSKEGNEHGGRCPFHSDQSRSLKIGANGWRCSACGSHELAGNDSIGFFACWTDSTREQAIAALGNGAGLPEAKPVEQRPLKQLPFWGWRHLDKMPKAKVWIHELSGSVLCWRELLPDRVHLGLIRGQSHSAENLAIVAGRSCVLVPEPTPGGRLRMSILASELQQAGHEKVQWIDVTDGISTIEGDPHDWAKKRSSLYKRYPKLGEAIQEPPGSPLGHEEIPSPDASDSPASAQPSPRRANGQGGPAGPPETPEQRAAAYERSSRVEVLSGLIYTCIADVQPEAVKWLWPGRIPLGELTMIVGDPGLGKSQICASLASVVTNGGQWPVDRSFAEVGSVLILSAEDNIKHTIRPRLDAAGADVTRCHTLQAVKRQAEDGTSFEGGFSLALDLAKLSVLMDELKDVRLVIIDPVSAYLGETDSHKNAEVRGMLAPLTTLAGAHKAAIILVSHLTKSQSANALMRVQGSIAFAALCRAVWGVTADKDDRARRLFMPLKNNLGQDKTGLAYQIEPYTLDNPEEPIPTSRIMWEAQLVETTVEEAFGAALSHEERSEIDDAKEFLREALSEGRLKAKDVQASARSAGHSSTTLTRAKKQLKVASEREGFGKDAVWYWRIKEPATAQPEPTRSWLPPD